MTSILQQARAYQDQGLSVIPVLARDKKPAIAWKEFQGRQATDQELEAWFNTERQAAGCNLGLVTGYGNLVVLDFDDRGAYAKWQDWAILAGGMAEDIALGETLVVDTARGVHVYLRLLQPTRTRPIREHGIDIKGIGGYVLAPPSIHPSGVLYQSPTPTAPILRVDTLSEVLPVAVLTSLNKKPQNGRNKTEVSDKVSQTSGNPITNDPWQAVAGNPITASTVERVKVAYRIEDLVPPITQTGNDFSLARCPFHDDHNPSFWLNTERQLCGCFAGCTDPAKPLDVINLFARLYDLTNREAIQVMIGRLG